MASPVGHPSGWHSHSCPRQLQRQHRVAYDVMQSCKHKQGHVSCARVQKVRTTAELRCAMLLLYPPGSSPYSGRHGSAGVWRSCGVSACGLARSSCPDPASGWRSAKPVRHASCLLSHCHADQLWQRRAAQLLQAHATSFLCPMSQQLLRPRQSCLRCRGCQKPGPHRHRWGSSRNDCCSSGRCCRGYTECCSSLC